MPKIATADQLIRLAVLADERGFNRTVKTEDLRHLLDPEGVNVVGEHYMEGDGRVIRCTWYAKYRQDFRPHGLILDVDPGDFNRLEDFPDG